MFTPVNVAKFNTTASALCTWLHALPDVCLAQHARRQRSRSPSGSPFRDNRRQTRSRSNSSNHKRPQSRNREVPLTKARMPGSFAGMSSIDRTDGSPVTSSFNVRAHASGLDSPVRTDFLNSSVMEDDEYSQAQAAVDKLLPALRRAEEALRCVTSADVDELKQLEKPSEDIVKVMGAVMLLFGQHQDWGTSKKFLNMPNFADMIHSFDAKNAPLQTLERAKDIIATDEELRPELLITESAGAASMSEWLLALVKFRNIYDLADKRWQRLHKLVQSRESSPIKPFKDN